MKIKRLFLIWSAVLIILMLGGVNALAFEDVNMTFDNGTEGWTLSEETGTLEAETVESKTCVYINSPGVKTAYKAVLDEPVANDGGIYVMSYDVLIPVINTDTSVPKQTIMVEGHSSKDLNSFYGLVINNGVVSYYNGTAQYSGSTAYSNGSMLTLTENEWHNLKTVYDRTKKTFTYYVDGVPVVDADGAIVKVTPYTKVVDVDITSVIIRGRNIDTDKIYIDNISLYKTDINYEELYMNFENGVSDFSIRSGSGEVSAASVDSEHGSSMAVKCGSTSTYCEYTLGNPVTQDYDIYALSYDMYRTPNTSSAKQTLSVVGLDQYNVNTFYGLRVDNGIVYYYNGEGQYNVSAAYKDGNVLTLTAEQWYNIKTVWDRASGIFTYYIDDEPLRNLKGDIVKVKVRNSELNKTVAKISVISRNTTTNTIYIDNLHLRKTEKLHDDSRVNIYNLTVKDSSGTDFVSSDISDASELNVSFDYDASENFMTLIGFYGGDTLKGVECIKTDVSDSGYTSFVSRDVTNSYGADSIKVFVWDGLENIKPYKVYTQVQNSGEITQKLNATEIEDDYFKMSGDSLTIAYPNGSAVVLKAPVLSSDSSENTKKKYDSEAGGPETAYYINFTVKDPSYHNRKDGVVYELDVKYFDKGYGCFTLEYDTVNESLKEAEYVQLNNTELWKTHTFVLKNPCFTGDGTDFRLCTWGEMMRYSNFDVYFGRVTLRSRGTRDQFIIKTTGDALGNIYYTGDKPTFTTTISNRDFYEYSNTFGTYDAQVKFTLLDENQKEIRVLDEQTVSVNPTSVTGKITTTFELDTYGLYYLKTEVINEERGLKGEKLTELSYVHSDKTTVNPDYGTSIQIAIYTTDGAETLAKNAGIGMLRWVRPMGDVMSITYDDSGSALTTKGWSSNWTKYDNLVSENGYTLLNNLLARSMIYSSEKAGGYTLRVPYGETGRDYYAQFCKFFAENAPADTKYYEIWNEFDSYAGTSFNMNGEDWSAYGDILVAAADAIYAVDPDAEIVALSSRFVGTHELAIKRVKELIDSGVAENTLQDYFKNASIHPYHWSENPMDFVSTDNTIPDATTMYEHMNELRKVYDKYGLTETKLWISEVAWSPGYTSHYDKKPITDKQQGSYLVQSYVMAKKNNLTDKFLPYLFARQTNVRVDRDKNMGIIKNTNSNLVDVPYAATSAYLAVANLNMLMTGASYNSDFFFDENETSCAYRFTGADGGDIAILWSTSESGESVSLNLGTAGVTVYDEYGNAETRTSETGIYDFTLTQSTVYVTGEFTTFSKE